MYTIHLEKMLCKAMGMLTKEQIAEVKNESDYADGIEWYVGQLYNTMAPYRFPTEELKEKCIKEIEKLGFKYNEKGC